LQLCHRLVLLVRATRDDLQRIIRQRALQLWYAHPHVALLIGGEDYRTQTIAPEFYRSGSCAAPLEHGKHHLRIIFDFDLLMECEREAVLE
jgi:hypothetical protein